MVHRWPTLYGTALKSTDIVVGRVGSENTKPARLLGLKYSESNLAQCTSDRCAKFLVTQWHTAYFTV